jgi:hypothetical protein
MADDIRTLADKEGLTAHRSSVDVRLDGDCSKDGRATGGLP